MLPSLQAPVAAIDPDQGFTEEPPMVEADRSHPLFDPVRTALKTVYDPEIPVNIYELGLIYRIDFLEEGRVRIDMTLTAPGCPVAGEMPGMVKDAVATVEGVTEIEVEMVWDPAWSPERMNDLARIELGFF